MLRYSCKKEPNVSIEKAFILRTENGILFDRTNTQPSLNPYSHPDLYINIKRDSSFENYRERYKIVFGEDIESDMPEIINSKRIILTNEGIVLLELSESDFVIYDPYDPTENSAVSYTSDNRQNFVIAPFISSDSEEKILGKKIKSSFRYNKYTTFQPTTIQCSVEEANGMKETLKGLLDEGEASLDNYTILRLKADVRPFMIKEYKYKKGDKTGETVKVFYFLEKFLDSSRQFSLGEGEVLETDLEDNGFEGYSKEVADEFKNLSVFAINAKAEILVRIASSDFNIPSDARLLVLRKDQNKEIVATQSLKSFNTESKMTNNFSNCLSTSKRELVGYNFNSEFIPETGHNASKEYVEIYLLMKSSAVDDGSSTNLTRKINLTAEVR